jgi:hypothetical protein
MIVIMLVDILIVDVVAVVMVVIVAAAVIGIHDVPSNNNRGNGVDRSSSNSGSISSNIGSNNNS